MTEENGSSGSARRIASALTWSWQVLLRGIGFAAYGVAALTLGFVVLPLQRLGSRWRASSDDPQIRAQRAIHWTTRGWLALVKGMGLVRVRETGAERLRARPVLVVANHPSLIDSPVLTACMPQADFVVSPEWTRNPFLRRTIEQAGYLRAETGSALLREAVARLRAGRSVVVYPEGSRTPPEGLRPFQRGIAHIALRAGCDIVPVVIRVRPRWLMKGQSLTQRNAVAPEWHVEVGAPIDPRDHVQPGDSRKDSARRIVAVLQDYFEKRWDTRGSR
jgi:1-acyl-sn-glycerol-3-phosphate acyltransferase